MPSQIRTLLLCGGLSTRFGSNKLLAMLDGEPLVARSARNLIAGAGSALAVIPTGSEELHRVLDDAGCTVIESPDCARGMGASLASGVAASATADGWIVALGDMPFVKPLTIATVLDKIEKGAIIAAPVYQGVRGHPVGFARSLKAELLALDGDEGARSVVAAHRDALETIIVTDPGVNADVDVAADLVNRGGA